ncbi:metal ABC transporter substrate-binding protein [Clostridium sp. HCP1S3_B4]|uniref:metal ABC transporter substrate-binding protein n=1 Tax=unclassified Clostridium TaxID=2614128 RepID=UPI002A7CE042|nr:zinc ABC transporter substrate-binding protein [Clostridium sp.]
MKKVTFVMLIITFIMYIGLNFFSDQGIADTSYSEDSVRDTYLNIMVCNKSQYYMVKKIVGERHNIQYLFNNEEKIDAFRYDKGVVDNVSNMDIFIYSGNSFENWDSAFINDLDKSKVGVINISRGIRTLNYNDETNKTNPYYWTGLEEYKIALYNIKNAIQDRDPKNRDLYEKNYNTAISYLEQSLSIYNGKRNDLNNYIFISLDEKLAYFFRDLGIDTYLLKGDSIEKYIVDNNFDLSKVVIVRDAKTEFNNPQYKLLTFESFDSNKSYEDIMFNNYKELYSLNVIDKNN